jgi:hypothetical protein
VPDIVPYWLPGQTLTGHAVAAITGGRFLIPSGQPVDGNPGVIHGATPENVIGVAARDAAILGKVLIFAAPGTILPIRVAAAVVTGDKIATDANGAGVVAGIGAVFNAVVLQDAAANTEAMCRFEKGQRA